MKVILLTHTNNTNDTLMSQIVDAINSAISENIYEDYKRAELDESHSNSIHQRQWDYINKNLNNIVGSRITGGYTKRGIWNAYSLFDKDSGIIYSFLKERRFNSLAKKLKENPHYIQALATRGNPDLQPSQLSFFSMKPEKCEVDRIFDQVCSDLMITPSMVKGHKVVLFSNHNGVLSSVRCCTVDWSFETHESIDLTPYINVSESIIVEEVSEPISKKNNPTLGLKLKPKAKERSNLKGNVNVKEVTEVSKKKTE